MWYNVVSFFALFSIIHAILYQSILFVCLIIWKFINVTVILNMWFTDQEEPLWGSSVQYAIGMDEAGRGCMAGPVAVSAVLLRVTPEKMPFPIDDSKKLSLSNRCDGLNALCDAIGNDPVVWRQTVLTKHHAFALHPAPLSPAARVLAMCTQLRSSEEIDKMNISNASLEGMSSACAEVVGGAQTAGIRLTPENTAIFVDGKVLPWTFLDNTQRMKIRSKKKKKVSDEQRVGKEHAVLRSFHAKAIVDGDQKLCCVACASVISKVVRDAYCVEVMDEKCPQYDFKSHKGYCTSRHRELLKQFGISVFHRKSYAPVQQILGLSDNNTGVKKKSTSNSVGKSKTEEHRLKRKRKRSDG